jgi:hypothetical protein
MRLRSATVLGLCLIAASCQDGPTVSKTDPVGPPAAVLIVSGNEQPALVGQELPAPLVVKVVDANNRPVQGHAVNFKVVSGGGSVFAGTAITNAAGEARERWTLGTTTAAPQRVEVRAVNSATGEAIVYAVFTATASPAAPAVLRLLGPPVRTGVVGTPLADSLAVRVADQYDNPVPGVSVSWAVRAGGGSVSPTSTVTDASGVSKTQWSFGNRTDSAQVAEAAAGTLAIVGINGIAVAGPPASLVPVAGDGARIEVGTAQTIQARVTDAHGNPIQGHQVHWTVASGSGAVAAPSSTTNTAGVAAMTWRLGETAGAQSATANVASPVTPASFRVTAVPGSPSSAAFLVQPTDTRANVPISPSIQVVVKDRFGNVATNATAPLNLQLLAPNLAIIKETGTQHIQVVPVDGIAIFRSITIDKPTPDFSPIFAATMQGWLGQQTAYSNRFTVLP